MHGQRSSDLVTRQQLVDEALSVLVHEVRARPAKRFGDQEVARPIEDRRMELDELEVGDASAAPGRREDALAVADAAVGRTAVETRVATGAQDGDPGGDCDVTHKGRSDANPVA